MPVVALLFISIMIFGCAASASGKTVALAVRAAFAPFAKTITVMPDCNDLACLQKIKLTGSEYYVIPEILHWEDRATEWSGIPDKIKIQISVYDGQALEKLASTIISGTSRWATFGGDHPQDLLSEPLNRYVESLY